jgi:ribosome assembly protein YihI (activator of Der GTPase)
MASKWFPGIKDAAYWREKKKREYEKEARQRKEKRIRKRPEPSESYSEIAINTGADIRISRAGSKNPWYLEITEDGSTSVSELYRMSKASALEHLQYMKENYRPKPAETIKYDVDTLSLDGAIDALKEIKSRSVSSLNSVEIDRIEQAITRAKEIIATAV